MKWATSGLHILAFKTKKGGWGAHPTRLGCKQWRSKEKEEVVDKPSVISLWSLFSLHKWREGVKRSCRWQGRWRAFYFINVVHEIVYLWVPLTQTVPFFSGTALREIYGSIDCLKGPFDRLTWYRTEDFKTLPSSRSTESQRLHVFHRRAVFSSQKAQKAHTLPHLTRLMGRVRDQRAFFLAGFPWICQRAAEVFYTVPQIFFYCRRNRIQVSFVVEASFVVSSRRLLIGSAHSEELFAASWRLDSTCILRFPTINLLLLLPSSAQRFCKSKSRFKPVGKSTHFHLEYRTCIIPHGLCH